MKIVKAAVIVSVLTGVLAGRASAAGVMYSAPVSGSTNLYCDIRNAGKTQIAGTIETVGYTGAVTSGPFNFTLDPGVGTAHFSSSVASASCKVTLTKGLPRNVRGVALYNYGTDAVFTIPIQ